MKLTEVGRLCGHVKLLNFKSKQTPAPDLLGHQPAMNYSGELP